MQTDISQPEGCKSILSKFNRIIPSLLKQRGIRRIHCANLLEGFPQIGDGKRFIALLSRFAIGRATGAEHIENQHGKMTGQSATAFAHQGWHWHAERHAALPDRCDDVIGVVLKRIIRRCRARRAAAVVVDAEASANVEETHWGSEASEFDVDLSSLLQGVLQHGDVIDLTADVEMQQPKVLE